MPSDVRRDSVDGQQAPAVRATELQIAVRQALSTLYPKRTVALTRNAFLTLRLHYTLQTKRVSILTYKAK